MLTKSQKKMLQGGLEPEDSNHRALRKRIIDGSVKSVEDLTLVFQHADLLPDLKRRLPPARIEELINSYFTVFKVGPAFADPEKVIKLYDEIAVLQRKNAALAQELGDMVHQIEHFKYVATHTTRLLEMERAKPDGPEIVTKM